MTEPQGRAERRENGEVPSVRIPAQLPDGVSQATIGVRGGLLRSGFEETAEALYLTSGYVYETAADAEKAFTGEIDRYVYSRYGNPTISMFEERLRLIEGAPAAFATATGMAAVFTSLAALLSAGDRLVAARSLFGSCFVVCNEILPRWGIETVFVDGDDLDQWEQALSVPIGGVLQLAWLFLACRAAGVSLRPRMPKIDADVKRLMQLILPAAIGAGAVQFTALTSPVRGSWTV